jgi:hypothetical protein
VAGNPFMLKGMTSLLFDSFISSSDDLIYFMALGEVFFWRHSRAGMGREFPLLVRQARAVCGIGAALVRHDRRQPLISSSDD